ncbi:hypothetical protein ARMGADRAFT_133381 [Armillaria gallica]|uniref:Uncharacterized protein n=1 Tax=Armillaria gallica TaxID=47427 RepID=A0A2H3DER2_ARMGA|nr:hypothetical protein ARMGADRAFT_133381 [Armillaria gallica]
MYFLMCFLVRVFVTITGKITTEYLTPGYHRPVTGVLALPLGVIVAFRTVSRPLSWSSHIDSFILCLAEALLSDKQTSWLPSHCVFLVSGARRT